MSTQDYPQPQCEAARRDGTRCPHHANFVCFHNGQLLFICGVHRPGWYDAAHGFPFIGEHQEAVEQLDPGWIESIIPLYEQEAQRLRQRAISWRDSATEAEQEAERLQHGAGWLGEQLHLRGQNNAS